MFLKNLNIITNMKILKMILKRKWFAWFVFGSLILILDEGAVLDLCAWRGSPHLLTFNFGSWITAIHKMNHEKNQERIFSTFTFFRHIIMGLWRKSTHMSKNCMCHLRVQRKWKIYSITSNWPYLRVDTMSSKFSCRKKTIANCTQIYN